MAYALVAHLLQQSADGNGFTSSSIDTTGANLLLLYLSANDNTPTISDSKANTWTSAATSVGGFNGSDLYYAKNAASGTGHTFTVTGASKHESIAVLAFSGADTTAPLGSTNNAHHISGTTIQPGSVTPAEANDLIVTALTFQGTSGVQSIDSGFTITDQAVGVQFQSLGIAMAYLIQGAAAAVNPTWTDTVSDVVDAVVATFKVGAAAGSPVFPFQRPARRDPWHSARAWAANR